MSLLLPRAELRAGALPSLLEIERSGKPYRPTRHQMGMVVGFLNWGGVASLALGGLLALVGAFKGKEARQLEAAREVQSLAGEKGGRRAPWHSSLLCGGRPRDARRPAPGPLPAALKALLNMVPLLVAISGRVFAEKPLKTELAKEPKQAAIVQVRRSAPPARPPRTGALHQASCSAVAAAAAGRVCRGNCHLWRPVRPEAGPAALPAA